MATQIPGVVDTLETIGQSHSICTRLERFRARPSTDLHSFALGPRPDPLRHRTPKTTVGKGAHDFGALLSPLMRYETAKQNVAACNEQIINAFEAA